MSPARCQGAKRVVAHEIDPRMAAEAYYIYIYIYMYMYIYTHVLYIYIYVYTCHYIYIYIYTHMCRYTYTPAYDYIYIHIYIYIYMYMYVYGGARDRPENGCGGARGFFCFTCQILFSAESHWKSDMVVSFRGQGFF